MPFGVSTAGSTPPQFLGHTSSVRAAEQRCQFTVSAWAADIADGATFTTQTVEGTDRTFIQPGKAGIDNARLSGQRFCMYWES